MKDRMPVAAAVLLVGLFASCQTDPTHKTAAITIEKARPLAAARPKMPPGTRLASFPPRAKDAEGGRAFLDGLGNMPVSEREEAIYQEILAGNVPNHLRTMMPIKLRAVARDGSIITGTAWVLPDYLAIGSDDDFVRVPINQFTATRLADDLGFALPTQKLVNAIYSQAKVHLRPRPLPAGPEMTTTEYFQRHNDIIEDQLKAADVDDTVAGTLIAGHKKDVVMSNRLSKRPGRIAIYGWHKPDSKPIQPLSTVHDAAYADYSHGIRFVDPVLRVNGRDVAISKVLADGRMADLLSSEGRIIHYDDLMHPTRFALGTPAH